MDLDEAATYVQERGDVVERARLAAILRDEPPAEVVLQELAGRQFPDGGFAHWLPHVSNLCDTAYILQWFDDLKVYRGPTVERACRFLLDHQLADGGWDEVEAVQGFGPPGWMTPGWIETRVWLTGFCAHVLIRFGYAEAPDTHCPTDFLLAHADNAGRLAGYLRATWLALPVLAFYPETDSEPFQKAVAVVAANYAPDWPGAYLAWLLRCLQDAGLPPGYPLVARALADLVCKQRPDGSWAPENSESEAHAIDATLGALRVLRGYGRI